MGGEADGPGPHSSLRGEEVRASGWKIRSPAKACSKALRVMTGVVHPPQCYGGRVTEDGSAVRLVRPNGADAKLRARTDRCRATYSGSRLLGEGYTFICGGGGG